VDVFGELRLALSLGGVLLEIERRTHAVEDVLSGMLLRREPPDRLPDGVIPRERCFENQAREPYAPDRSRAIHLGSRTIHRVPIAQLDPSLEARIVARRALSYAAGPDPDEDRPPHVRAGSGLAWFRDRLWIAQDDAAFLAHLEDVDAPVQSIALGALDDGRRLHDDRRGNKRLKLDLESIVALPDRLLLFGSGSSPRRERIIEVRDGTRVIDGRALYAAMRANERFSGSDLNVEGAVHHAGDIVLFQRCNGAPTSATARVSADALCAWLDGGPTPTLRDVTVWELGAIEGTRLGFTDAVALGDRILYLAAAEASPDATRDGPVTGAVLGTLDAAPRYCLVTNEHGEPTREKLEGLARDRTDPHRLLAIIDRDDPEVPSDLVVIELRGPWMSG